MQRFLAVCAAVLGLTLAAGSYGPSRASAELKVLKGKSMGEIKGIMKQQAKWLGVDCDFCHKTPDMAADTPLKETARKMMLMTQSISAQLAKAGVTKTASCNLCHRGASKPQF